MIQLLDGEWQVLGATSIGRDHCWCHARGVFLLQWLQRIQQSCTMLHDVAPCCTLATQHKHFYPQSLAQLGQLLVKAFHSRRWSMKSQTTRTHSSPIRSWSTQRSLHSCHLCRFLRNLHIGTAKMALSKNGHVILIGYINLINHKILACPPLSDEPKCCDRLGRMSRMESSFCKAQWQRAATKASKWKAMTTQWRIWKQRQFIQMHFKVKASGHVR